MLVKLYIILYFTALAVYIQTMIITPIKDNESISIIVRFLMGLILCWGYPLFILIFAVGRLSMILDFLFSTGSKEKENEE